MLRTLIGNFKGPKGDRGDTGLRGNQGPRGKQGEPGSVNGDSAIYFTVEQSRVNINSGEKCAILFGKIQKFFADLKTVAFTGNYEDLIDKPEVRTAPGIYYHNSYFGSSVTNVSYSTLIVPSGYTLKNGDFVLNKSSLFMINRVEGDIVHINWLLSL